MIKARIVIVDYNSQPHLERCVEALSRQSDTRFEVVIVNNGDSAIEAPQAWSEYNWLSIIESTTNTGFAGGSNLGAKGAKTEWIITLNPDAWPEPDWFATLMHVADIEPDFGMLSSTLVSQENPNVLDGGGEVYSIFGLSWRGGQGGPVEALSKNNRSVLGPCGAAAAYRSVLFLKAGGFDEAYFCFLEDVDLALRLQLQGQTCLHVRDALVHHIGGGSSGAGSEFQIYHNYRNHIRLIVKTAPILVLIPQIFIYYAVQVWFTLRAMRQAHWSARVKGLFIGLFRAPKVLFQDRKTVQKSRTLSTRNYLKLISLSPKALSQKAIVPE